MIIQKNQKNEYSLNLCKIIKVKKGSIFACGKPSDSNTKLLKAYTLSNDMVNLITSKSTLPQGQTFVKIQDFLEIEAKQFVKKLKDLTILGLDQ